MASITCGNCDQTHFSVADVRACHEHSGSAGATSTVRRSASVATVPVIPRPLEEGYYSNGSEIVQLVLSKTDRLYAKRLVIIDGRGSWVYAPGLISRMQNYSPLTLEQASEFGVRFGVCAVCGRTLTNPDSIDRGIGPVCAEGF